jgi:hypothetical protein
VLRLDIEPTSHDIEDRVPRFPRRLGNIVYEAVMIDH